MTEQRIRTLQREVGKNLRRRKFPWRSPDIDGKLGAITFKAAGFSLYQMGAPDKMVRAAHEGHIGRTAFDYLTHRKARPASWLRRDKNRRPHCAELRRLHREAIEEAKSLDGIVRTKYSSGEVYVAAWIEKENDKIAAAGCVFAVVSGYRTQAYSISLCIAMCGAVSCPGRCAGALTNHACPPDGKCLERLHNGAEDVTNYYVFEATAARIGSLLKNDLPSDPVHFSLSGH